MAENYGNLALGQITKLLILIIGQDAAIEMADKQNIPITEDDLKRMFKEEDRRFIHFRPSEKTSAVELFRQFFRFIEEQYSFPKEVASFIQLYFWGVFRDALRGNGSISLGDNSFKLKEGGLIPYEKQTSKLALLLLNWSLGYLGIKDKNNKTVISKESVLELLNDSYEDIIEAVIKDKDINKNDYYIKLNASFEIKNPGLKEYPDFKQRIQRSRIDKAKLSWMMLKFFLISEKPEKKLAIRLISLYLLKNTEMALKEICGIEQKEIHNIKQDILLWANNKLPDAPQSESQCFLMMAGKYDPTDLSILQKEFINPDFEEQKKIIQECINYLHEISSIKQERAELLIHAIENEAKCSHCRIFFSSWARARLLILSCVFDGSDDDRYLQEKALEYYNTAFEKGRNFAGVYLKEFLEESIAVTVYFDRKETKDIPDVIEHHNKQYNNNEGNIKNDTTPITINAKRYYEYGYALNLFEQNSSKTYLLHFNAREHFWLFFPVSSFINEKSALKYRTTEEMLKIRWWYYNFENVYNLEFIKTSFNSVKHSEKLERIAKSSSSDIINRRMDLFPGYIIKYTPLTLAIMTRQIDIAERFLVKFNSDILDVTKINTDGSTALSEVLLQYKLIRFSDRKDNDIEIQSKRYKKIIFLLVERFSAYILKKETVTNYISVLEEAINTFDIEIVKAIVETDKFNINNLKISADELSPLYYAVNRLTFISDALMNGSIELGSNITWKNFNIPGISTENKQKNYNKMQANPLFKLIDQFSQNQFIGNSSVWKQEYNELLDIVQYLIDRTEDVDAFAKKTIDEKSYTNVLSLAVESNFYNICRKLIEKGADPARIFTHNGKPYDSPFIRAVWFKSWDTLEMLLTDFIDKIKPKINESFTDEKYTAAHLLFRVGNESIYKFEIDQDNFRNIELFLPLFKSVGANFDIPDIQGITVRKILKDKNYEYLVN